VAANIIDGDGVRISQIQSFFKPVHTTGTAKCRPGQPFATVSDLLRPYDARLMRCYPVSSRINHVVNDDEECSKLAEVLHIQSGLFL
jgi:hypothetical protein